jgi:hypothetical protein
MYCETEEEPAPTGNAEFFQNIWLAGAINLFLLRENGICAGRFAAGDPCPHIFFSRGLSTDNVETFKPLSTEIH